MQTTVYAAIFLCIPVYLLGQTVPLLSNYFGRARIAALTGRMLFFSTVGSFLGSVFSTLVLMNTIGVHRTAIVTLSLLGLLVPLLARRIACYETFLVLLILAAAAGMNAPAAFSALHIVSNNRYNTVSIQKSARPDERILSINNSMASALGKENARTLPYIQYIERNFITPITVADQTQRDFLILGAGGFTLGLDDHHNHYTFVDIDKDLKEVAERDFIGAKLTANKHFVAASARAFLRRAPAAYDLIVIDTYTHILSVPMETATEEFLGEAKRCLKPGGTLIVNQILSPDFRDRLSVRYDHVFAHVFGLYTRQVIGDYNAWQTPRSTRDLRNVLYIYHDRPYNADDASYTDDRNTYSLDR